MKILTFSTLYPNPGMPRHGIFVENRLRHLLASGEVESRVVAPVPWFPFRSAMFGDYAKFAAVPQAEARHGIQIVHPRYILIPKIGMAMTPGFMARALLKSARQILASGYDFDLIDAHYFYPDGVAAAFVANRLNKPLVITARGTDLNLIPRYPKPREMILEAATRSNAMITVCKALKDVLLELGVPDSKVNVLRNGVDLELFRPPHDREALRKRLGLHGTVLLSVGHLIERKGHDLVIRALKQLQDTRLLIAGDGEELRKLKQLVSHEGLEDRVEFLGAIPHEALRDYYGAADALVLASSREGWANVLLESMACGTPVVATNIWGTPEVVATPESGVLVDRDPQSIGVGIRKLMQHYPDRIATRRYAEGFSWDATTRGQLDLFNEIIKNNKA